MSEMDVSENLGRAHAIFEGLCREQTRRGKNGNRLAREKARYPGFLVMPPARTENGVCWFVGHRPVMSPMSVTSSATSRLRAIPKSIFRFLSRCMFAALRNIVISSGRLSVSTRPFPPVLPTTLLSRWIRRSSPVPWHLPQPTALICRSAQSSPPSQLQAGPERSPRMSL